MIEVGAVASESTNLTLGNINALTAGPSSYRKNEAADVASVDMSFDDFIDMINPLEHIPVLSSIYRALEGEKISPVSRIAGDALYGGALGPVSAALSAAGAIGDEMVASNNDGQSASGFMVAALYGNDTQPTQLAQASGSQASAAPIVQASAATANAAPTASPAPAAPATADNTASKGMLLDRSKLPYGGVMDSSMIANAQQNQTLALALASQHQALQTQHLVRNSRFATNTSASTTPPESTPAMTVAPEPETEAAMQNLLQELQAMKSVNQYKSSAQATPVPGGLFDATN